MLAAGERVNAFGARYMGDRVIVKFRDGVTAASRESAVSAVTPEGRWRRAGRGRTSTWSDGGHRRCRNGCRVVSDARRVEYAQAAYRVQADRASVDRFVPDDHSIRRSGISDDGFGASLEDPAGGRVGHHGGGPRHRHCVHRPHDGIHRRRVLRRLGAPCAARVVSDRRPHAVSCARSVSLNFAHATELEPLTRFVAPATSSGTTICRSI